MSKQEFDEWASRNGGIQATKTQHQEQYSPPKKEKKPYIKVIKMGHVIQVYEMEREPNLDHERKDREDSDEILSYLGISADPEETKERNKKNREKWLEEKVEKEDRVAERRGQTLRDAKNSLKRLALMNYDSNDLFITLTYKENMNDVERGDRDLKEWVKNMREELGQNFSYIAVREFQKRGALHYHMMTDIKLNFTEKWEVEVYERDFAKVWGNGFVDIQRMDRHKSKRTQFRDKPIDNVGAYLSKYFSKSAEDPRLEGHHIYLTSKGLNRPEVIKGDQAEEYLQKLDEKKIVFTNEYESEFLGKIQFKEYNLIRL